MSISESTNDGLDEPRFCAPVDFGQWHITDDGETTLCQQYSIEAHHISGKVDGHDANRDCHRCMAIYGHRFTDN